MHSDLAALPRAQQHRAVPTGGLQRLKRALLGGRAQPPAPGAAPYVVREGSAGSAWNCAGSTVITTERFVRANSRFPLPREHLPVPQPGFPHCRIPALLILPAPAAMNRSFFALRTCNISGAGGARQVWRGLEARLLIFPAFLGGVTVETRETPRGGTRAAVALRAQRSERQITQLRRSSLPPSLLPPSLPAGSIPPSLRRRTHGGRRRWWRPRDGGGGPGPSSFPPLSIPRLPPALSFPLQVAEPGAAAPESRGPRAGEQGGGAGGPIWGSGNGGAACAGGIERQRVLGEGSAPGLQHSPWHTPDTRHACSSPALHAAAPHCTHLHRAHRAATQALEPYCMHWVPAVGITCIVVTGPAVHPHPMYRTRPWCIVPIWHASYPYGVHQNPTACTKPTLHAPEPHWAHQPHPLCTSPAPHALDIPCLHAPDPHLLHAEPSCASQHYGALQELELLCNWDLIT